jgi:mono/diheme cytochrome c family protein
MPTFLLGLNALRLQSAGPTFFIGLNFRTNQGTAVSALCFRYHASIQSVAGMVIAILAVLLPACSALGQAQSDSLEQAKADGALRSSYRHQTPRPMSTGTPKPNLRQFQEEIGPVLKKTCGQCHGPETHEASFRVDTLDPDLINGQDAAWWVEVVQVLSNGEMPPADEDVQLTDEDRANIIDWLSTELQLASQVARSEHGHSAFRRMTRYEYNYALQDLLGLPYDFARDLPPETASEDGFQNSSEMLHMSAVQFATYSELGRNALLNATVRGERPESVYYSIPMDAAAELMRSGRDKGSFNPNSPHFVNLETSVGVQGRYSYGGARYSWKPSSTRPEVPKLSPQVFVLPANGRQIFDMGDQLPDTGTLRVRMRACRTTTAGETWPDLRISFGFQASNNSEAAFRVGNDLAIKASPDDPQFYELDIHLGEVSRNPYRGTMKLGSTPNPSEYLVLQNLHTDQKLGRIQMDYIEITAPLHEQWPPVSHRRIFFESANENDETTYAREVINHFMQQTWRRPVTDVEVDSKLELFGRLRRVSEDFQEAMIEVLATVISSPEFLYLVQSESHGDSINDFELATRLSMFLWCSVPDEELLSLASQGQLHQQDILARQVDRMLKDSRMQRFSKQFVRQWLGMQLLDYLQIDRNAHREFDELLREAAQQEPIATFQHMLQGNISIMDFLHADYTLANERLARHYGIPNVYGSEFRKVSLTPEHRRGGLLTQAGLLAMNSDGKDSHPLKRGIWLLENLLNDPPPPPPPAVPEIDLTDPEILKLTLKERMEDHRIDPACMACHARIDPWGIAFENFDAAGGWRDMVKDRPVDATSVLFNQQTLNGMEGLKRFLLENRQDQFARAMTHKLSAYALGRPLTFADRASVEQITADLRNKDDGLATLITLVVTSDLFRSR